MVLRNNVCVGVEAPRYLSFTTAVTTGIFSVITVIGNLMVCLAVLKDPYKELRIPFNFYIVNLALADLIVGLVTEPIAVWLHIREWLSLSTGGIWLVHMSYFVSCTASLLSLCALTLDRFKAITTPLKHRVQMLSLRKAFITSSVIWLVSLSLPFIYFAVGYLTYAFVFANTAIVLSFITLLFSYVRILQVLRAQIKHWNSKGGRNCSRTRKGAIVWEKRITQVFLLMLLLFVCCYTPSCVMIYIMNLCKSCSCYVVHWLRDLQFLFVLLSSSLNPFVYAWRMPSFRKAFVSLLLCKSCHKGIPLVGHNSNVPSKLKELSQADDNL